MNPLPLVSDLFRAKDWTAALQVLQGRDDAASLFNAGQAHMQLGHFELAVTHFRALLFDHPLDVRIWMKLGASALALQDHLSAELALTHAILVAPQDADVQHAYASLMATHLLDDRAIWHYQEAQRLRPGYMEAALGEAFCLLRQGNYKDGWVKFESRWGVLDRNDEYYHIPYWEGEHRGRVVIRAEQGFGDCLQFLRYIPLMAERVMEVYVEAHPLLRRWVEACPGVAGTFPAGTQPPEADAQAIIMSLPRIFGTEVGTIPPVVPPIIQPKDWKLPADKLKVGLCWAGGERKADVQANSVDQRRSIAFEKLRPLLDIPGVFWVSLQKERAAQKFMFDPMLSCQDFYDTAALIQNLDAVVTVDTAVLHLAATLGGAVFLLNRFDSCWRWKSEGDTSDWYPSVKVLRQPALGEWGPPIQRACDLVREMVKC